MSNLRELLKEAQDCIASLADGPSRANWGDMLDRIDAALAEPDKAESVPTEKLFDDLACREGLAGPSAERMAASRWFNAGLNCRKQVRWLYAEQADELAALRAEVERLQADAARYRWMRENPVSLGWDAYLSPEQMDAEVDRERLAAAPAKEHT